MVAGVFIRSNIVSKEVGVLCPMWLYQGDRSSMQPFGTIFLFAHSFRLLCGVKWVDLKNTLSC